VASGLDSEDTSIVASGFACAIHDFDPWREFGTAIRIENRDKRKPIGRTAAELQKIFEELPEATFCFDVGHARQFDPTMTAACMILPDFGKKLEASAYQRGEY
jgi:hypothetical protein